MIRGKINGRWTTFESCPRVGDWIQLDEKTVEVAQVVWEQRVPLAGEEGVYAPNIRCYVGGYVG